MLKILRFTLLLCAILNSGCVSTIVGTTADVAIAAVKVPFKVGSAVVDAVSSSDTDKESKK